MASGNSTSSSVKVVPLFFVTPREAWTSPTRSSKPFVTVYYLIHAQYL